MARFSFEFFPPKTDEQAAALLRTAALLARHRPHFVSVTYGAGGTSKERSLGAVTRILAETGLDPAAHITCVGTPSADVEAAAQAFHAAGIRRFVALRGDPVEGVGARYRAHKEGFQTTAALVAWLKGLGQDVEVSVAAYPEKHPESPDWATEIDTLKAKVEAGAVRAITQFFYEGDAFRRYRDRVAAAGISVPIVPGIMPITRLESVSNFASRCGATIPDWLRRRFAGLADGDTRYRETAIALGVEQIEGLAAEGVDTFHIYTMNRSDLTDGIVAAVNGEEAMRRPPRRLSA